jgi:Arc/MetJ-type ribon-helix-helix transcriptional regulator
MTTKLSVSLPDDDVALIDALAARFDGNRSAAVHDALRVVREQRAAADYERAMLEWESTGDAAAWDGGVADGLAG